MNTATDTATLAADLILSPDELRKIAGYTQSAKMLAELHRQGFYRARKGPTGIILERAHYLAVCAGNTPPKPAPQLRPRISK